MKAGSVSIAIFSMALVSILFSLGVSCLKHDKAWIYQLDCKSGEVIRSAHLSSDRVIFPGLPQWIEDKAGSFGDSLRIEYFNDRKSGIDEIQSTGHKNIQIYIDSGLYKVILLSADGNLWAAGITVNDKIVTLY